MSRLDFLAAAAICAMHLSRLGAEIVSMDSMALYRGLDIHAAKPTPEEFWTPVMR